MAIVIVISGVATQADPVHRKTYIILVPALLLSSSATSFSPVFGLLTSLNHRLSAGVVEMGFGFELRIGFQAVPVQVRYQVLLLPLSSAVKTPESEFMASDAICHCLAS